MNCTFSISCIAHLHLDVLFATGGGLQVSQNCVRSPRTEKGSKTFLGEYTGSIKYFKQLFKCAHKGRGECDYLVKNA